MADNRAPKGSNKKTFWSTSVFEIESEEALKKSQKEQRVQVLIQKAVQKLDQGDYDTAESYLRRGLAHVPDHTECMAYLAICLAESKRRFVTAEKVAKQVIEVQPHQASGYYALGRVNLSGSRRRAAFQNFQRARRLARDDQTLNAELDKIEPRKPPVIGVLPRNHTLNIYLGKLRVLIFSKPSRYVVLPISLMVLVWLVVKSMP
jgi:tetratricopeptide (TPR) repeat protein